TQSAAGSSFQFEMSQEGFSAILTPSGPILGAVGAYGWSGGIFMYQDGQQDGTWLNATKDRTDMKDSYMGYAVQQVQWDTLAIGAPRYQHLGSVFIYKKNPETSEWSQVAAFTADKIGSYFGSVLSVLHVNSTHSLLVVGAPTYYSPEAPGGQVYLCPVRNFWNSGGPLVTMACPETLQGDPRQPVGYFGSSISILPDLTGDDLPDLAVGAPCEDNYQGAIYIFPGQDESFRTSYIQRIAGRQVGGGIKYFGRSLSGNLDLTGDNLPDLAVGGEGRVLIMRSRPVLDVSISMTFDPSEIPLSVYECSEQRKVGSLTKLAVCLYSYKKNIAVTVEDFGQVTYSLLLDAGRTNTRALFSNAGRTLNATVPLAPGHVCVDHFFQLPECVEDSLSALRVSISFFLVGVPVLSEDSPSHVSSDLPPQVPFEKNCGGDGVCRDNLSVNITFTGVKQLVVGVSLDVNVTVSVMNEGEDSYNTRVLVPFPPGLSYRLVSLVESNKKVAISCASLEDQRVVNCGVNRPLLRPNTAAVFMVSFHVSPTAALGNSLTMTANVSSDNRQSHTDQMMSSSRLSVRYAVYVTVTSLEESSKYQNFSTGDSTIRHIYRVINLGQRQLPLTVTLMVPVRLGETPLWETRNITSSTVCKPIPEDPDASTCTEVGETPGAKDYQEVLRRQEAILVKPRQQIPLCLLQDGPRCPLRPLPSDLPFHIPPGAVFSMSPPCSLLSALQPSALSLSPQNCSVGWCVRVECEIRDLEVQRSLNFTVSGSVTKDWITQTGQQKIHLQSSAEIRYDSQIYAHILEQKERFIRAQAQTTLEIHLEYDYYPVIIGSSVGGLLLLALITAALYKLGFFKRQYKDMLGDPAESDSRHVGGPGGVGFDGRRTGHRRQLAMKPRTGMTE
ncbi:PREDICTED: integrin alpha-D-like, partial [Nanorana parkeri]|uniref:integrin alpha-D-like n=1 Tax=Nanorana parkeri TaxID=125878 RepID=UPI00085457C3